MKILSALLMVLICSICYGQESKTIRTEPTIIVDGIVKEPQFLKSIDPTKIESIQVLKNRYSFLIDHRRSDTVVVKMTCGSSHSSANQPLYVLDGKITEGSAINSIPPNDIQSIDILKGKSAIDKYGDKAKYGVIIVTMKCKEQNILTL